MALVESAQLNGGLEGSKGVNAVVAAEEYEHTMDTECIPHS